MVAVIYGLMTALIVYLIQVVFRYRRFARIGWWVIRHRKQSLRVSVATLCSLQVDGKYVLVKQTRRPEQIGPIGGAVDVFPSASKKLNEIGFVLERQFEPKWGLPRSALRGSLVATKLIGYARWLRVDSGRESFRECVEREFNEELVECGVSQSLVPRFRHFRFVRTAIEGPKYIPGREIWQWRFFRVFELIMESPYDDELQNAIRSSVENANGIHLVTPGEIKAGRIGQRTVIGSHAEYLLGPRASRFEIP